MNIRNGAAWKADTQWFGKRCFRKSGPKGSDPIDAGEIYTQSRKPYLCAKQDSWISARPPFTDVHSSQFDRNSNPAGCLPGEISGWS